MVLDAVAIATTVLVLDDVAGFGQVGDDAKRGALGDAERRGDLAEAHAGVVGDADEDSGVVGEEGPLRHYTTIIYISRNSLLVF